MTDLPPLLKSRQFHSRLFAIAVVLVLIVAEPWMKSGGGLRESMLWIGYFLVAIGAMGRVYCSAFIGGRKNDLVVRQGPFAVVRNPLYVFSFIATVGIGLQSGMLLVLALLVMAFLLYYPLVVAKEEAFLMHKFGEAYERYVQEVPRWIPNMKLWNEPELVEAMPKFIRRTMGDALIFFLPMPCFALLHMLHMQQVIPVWLILP
jgi:protein-S-isoprenylcysteine O-methyltransferase Ste14